MKEDGHLMGNADLHIHTSERDGMASVEQILDFVEHKTTLDVIAITDHDDLVAAFRARELAAKKRLRVEVVVGEEVTTLNGHLLALFLERPVPSLQSLAKTVEAVHAQGGLCIVPHPMSWLTHSIHQANLDKVMQGRMNGVHFDGFETVNPTFAGQISSARARELNRLRYHLPETGGSDAHFLAQVGSAYTTFPGKSAAALRESLLAGSTGAAHGAKVGLSKIGYRQILAQQFKALVVSPTHLVRRSLLRLLGVTST